MNILSSAVFNEFESYVKSSMSFCVTGLTGFVRLLSIKKILDISGKKVLFITSTEQTALRYSNDLDSFFRINSEILPYQNSSVYEPVNTNKYDYAKQLDILLKQPDLIIAPVKSLLEKFPATDFFNKNKLSLKIGDEIT
ncbi:MAG: hypothetical protein LUB59_02885, partial [Candidatus Gastranaerophilales bacterium]|nr:hypothetical protein [Candidatus Gastranaerophilales bacterium]